MDIDEINEHIRKLKCEETSWQSVNKLAALCTVRDELEEKQAPETQTQSLPPTDYRAAYSTAAEPQSDFVAAASSVPFGGLMQVLDEHNRIFFQELFCFALNILDGKFFPLSGIIPFSYLVLQ